MEMQEEFELGRKRSLSPRDRNQRGRSPGFGRGRSSYRDDSFRYDYNEHDRRERESRRRRFSGGRDNRDNVHGNHQIDFNRSRDGRGDTKQATGQSFDVSPSKSASRSRSRSLDKDGKRKKKHKKEKKRKKEKKDNEEKEKDKKKSERKDSTSDKKKDKTKQTMADFYDNMDDAMEARSLDIDQVQQPLRYVFLNFIWCYFV